jgi:hypothetical protein
MHEVVNIHFRVMDEAVGTSATRSAQSYVAQGQVPRRQRSLGDRLLVKKTGATSPELMGVWQLECLE